MAFRTRQIPECGPVRDLRAHAKAVTFEYLASVLGRSPVTRRLTAKALAAYGGVSGTRLAQVRAGAALIRIAPPGWGKGGIYPSDYELWRRACAVERARQVAEILSVTCDRLRP